LDTSDFLTQLLLDSQPQSTTLNLYLPIKKELMTKSQLIAIVAKKSHLTKKAATEAVETVFEEITRVLTKKKGEKVVVSGFGTFYVGKVKDKHVEPFGKKDQRTLVKGHGVVNFRAGKPLRREVW